jgi:hypothetical protein
MNRKPSIATRLMILCVAATLALPAVASAKLLAGDSPAVPIRHENGPALQVSAPAPTSTVTVSRSSSSTTLPVVLASLALGIALTGTAYVAVRLRSVGRSAPSR